MTPEDVKAARHALGLSVNEMADTLRLAMPNGATAVRQWEAGTRAISGPVSVAIELLLIADRARFYLNELGYKATFTPQGEAEAHALRDRVDAIICERESTHG